MPLGTIDRTPPPFFRQGLPALTKLIICAALSIFLMAADSRFALAFLLRAAIATVVLPLQQLLLLPIDAAVRASDYAQGLRRAETFARAAETKLTAQAVALARAQQLDNENAHLRALLALAPTLPATSIAAQVLYEAPDPFSRQLFIDRGSQHGVVPGAAVLSSDGVVGQVTRVYPLAAQVTLLVDRSAVTPVRDQRSGLRSAAYGDGPQGAMVLRFMPADSDVRVGDQLLTSGTDGIYPGGVPVAVVTRVEPRGESSFARIELRPTAAIDSVRQVLVVLPQRALLPAEVASAAAQSAASTASAGRRGLLSRPGRAGSAP